MYPKDVNQIGAWTFELLNPDGEKVTVPPSGSLPSLTDIHSAVMSIIQIYDEVTEGQYSAKQRQFAQKQGVSFEEFMKSVIQHQLCLRNKGVIPCWNDGLGDVMHEQAGKIDSFIDKNFKGKLKEATQKIVMMVTPSHTVSLGGCETCGGTTTFDPNVDNEGRAGVVNRVTGTKKKRTK